MIMGWDCFLIHSSVALENILKFVDYIYLMPIDIPSRIYKEKGTRNWACSTTLNIQILHV